MPSRDWEDIVVSGSRSTTLHEHGLRLVREESVDLRSELERLNQEQMSPPLSLTEVASIVRDLERRALRTEGPRS